MSTSPRHVEELELQAERERRRINQRVAEIRSGLEQNIVQRLNVKRLAEDRIRSRPAAFYSIAAALAALTGYILARLLKA